MSEQTRERTTTLAEILDAYAHNHTWVPEWVQGICCDALDISCGMTEEDFETNDRHRPSRLAYLLARL